MYGRVDVAQWPVGEKWQRLKTATKELQTYSRVLRYRTGCHFSIVVNTHVFSNRDEDVPPYEFMLLRFSDSQDEPRTETIGRFTDIDMMLALLKLLVGNLKQEFDSMGANNE